MRSIIISSCTKNKSGENVYLGDPEETPSPDDYAGTYWPSLHRTRTSVLGTNFTPLSELVRAFDLYIGHPRTQLYQDLRKSGIYGEIREAVLLKPHPEVEWYFLSGGYGILNAGELCQPYQATFSRSEAKKEKTPYTGKIWAPVLPPILDHILLGGFKPIEKVYFFGSKDYERMIKATAFYLLQKNRLELNVGRATNPTIRGRLLEVVKNLFL